MRGGVAAFSPHSEAFRRHMSPARNLQGSSRTAGLPHRLIGGKAVVPEASGCAHLGLTDPSKTSPRVHFVALSFTCGEITYLSMSFLHRLPEMRSFRWLSHAMEVENRETSEERSGRDPLQLPPMADAHAWLEYGLPAFPTRGSLHKVFRSAGAPSRHLLMTSSSLPSSQLRTPLR